MAVSVASRPLLFCTVLLAFASGGCMSKRQAVSLRTGGEIAPVVDVKPGYVERIALMDRYRLHDEMRKHMMHRPHVWVEEVAPEDIPADAPTESTDEENEQPSDGGDHLTSRRQ